MNLRNVIAIITSIFLILMWPLAVGKISESIFEKLEMEFVSHSERSGIVNHYEYNRGYFSSNSALNVSIMPEKYGLTAILGDASALQIDHKISHRLWDIKIKSTIQPKNNLDEAVGETFLIESTLSLSGHLDSQLILSESQKIKLALHGVEFGSRSILANIDRDGKWLIAFDLKQIALNDEQTQFYIDNSGLSLQGVLGEEGTDIMLHWGRLNINEYQFDTGLYQFDGRLNEMRLDNHHSLYIEQATLPSLWYNIELDWQLNNLSKIHFENFINSYHSNPNNQIWMPSFSSLLNEGLNSHFKISMDADKMAKAPIINAQMNTNLLKNEVNFAQHPTRLIQYLDGDLYIQAHKKLFEHDIDKQEILDEWFVMDLLKEENEHYIFTLELNNGDVVLNEKHEMPLLGFIFLLMQGV